MKIARFSSKGEDPRYGILDERHLVVLAGDPMYQGFETTGERVALADAKLLAPVIPRSKVIGVGLNYLEHASEMDERAGDDPVVFLKPNTSVIGPDEPIRLPADIGRVDHEGELAIVIGSLAKNVRREDFASVVLGYTIANDVTARDLQARDGQWTRSKGFDTFCPLGPVIETEIDPSDIRIETRVDGDLRQAGSTNEMVHDIPSLVEFVSSIWTLLPGDVILTGTPAGVGQIRDGEVVEVTISGIGTLKNPVIARH
ncbi:2-keto-4-pentenoate hydratase/2-oxohepta-3-ene-1,7-dioic acid hydratase in catechol pathway [Curtobacterium sp. PvP017]|uniref:Fumarylacetoacetate hydrolase family protein n=1 Tax=Curtobacterium citreum TaxID=2036 RepID=A0ABU8YDB2_9MICO|nr:MULTISPECIES: fumarylacetoacetate hydrolase family protein [Curtobacterium]PZO58271.1 MAG: 2-hydroxyhepta-2,4-diene-1,7-dioate isomerase [Leifsonia xyli]MBF4602274.1 fumarylacetoacetate hydrolase family protein [Curtobacterium sp. VKM Ac-2884]MBT1621682.1 fumarylacetoacetate hydrolase family protein [Curtobacterium flaccumfaciens pv. oortii]ROQ06802.1 2-keto-4-pentenoate hydratase/2-oxohepta-3-ene-1,7-dioic acid hydratase in catechol pathway [Curtobacterium sp. PhB171]ROQ27729.1 2-keto-4-pe